MSNYKWDKTIWKLLYSDLHFGKFDSEPCQMTKEWSEMIKEMKEKSTEYQWRKLEPAKPDFIEENEFIV